MQLETDAKHFSALYKTNNNMLVKFILAKNSADAEPSLQFALYNHEERNGTQHREYVHCSHQGTKPWVGSTSPSGLCNQDGTPSAPESYIPVKLDKKVTRTKL